MSKLRSLRRWTPSLHTPKERLLDAELLALTADRVSPRGTSLHPSVETRFATLQEIETVPRLLSAIAPENREFLRSGDRCVVQMRNGEVLGFSCVSTSSLAHIGFGVHLNLPDDTLFTYQHYTSAGEADAGSSVVRDSYALERLASEGKRRLLVAARVQDRVARAELVSGPYERVGHVRVNRRHKRIRIEIEVADHFWSCERRS